MEWKKQKDTMDRLRAAARQNDHAIVSFSGSKDSRVVLDMALKCFKRVDCFFMYFIPHLDYIDKQLQWAEKEYGVKIHQVPHWSVFNALKYGIYCDSPQSWDKMKEWHIRDIYNLVQRDLGRGWIINGIKKSDSVMRRKSIRLFKWDDVIMPLEDWLKGEVVSYCILRDIQVPPSEKGNATGVDLCAHYILWLHDTFPEDYAKMRAIFPYVEAAVKRREFYGKTR